MTKQNAQPEKGKSADAAIVTLAVLIAAGGVAAFTFLSDQTLTIRMLAMLGAFAVAIAVAAFSPSGKRFIAFGRDSYDELRRVVWPTRKETVNTTGIVMAFVVAVAFYLFFVDKLIEWGLYDGLLRITF